MGQVEVDIVDDDQVKISVAVIVEEGAPCTPALGREQTAFFRLVAKCAIPLIPVQDILPPLSHEHVGVAVIVDVTRADALPPTRTGTGDSRFFGYILKLQSAQVVIEERPGLRAVAQAAAIDQKNVGKTIVVVVENCHTRSSGLHDVLFSMVCPGDFNSCEAGLNSEVLVAHRGCLHAGREWAGWDRGTAGGHALSTTQAYLGPERSGQE